MSLAEDEEESKVEKAPLLSPIRYMFSSSSEPNVSSSSHPLEIVSASSEHNSGFIHESVSHGNKNYPVWVAISYLISYGIGAVIAVPYNFFEAGYILSPLTIVWIALLMYCTMVYVGNLCYRAEVITQLAIQHGYPKSAIYDNPQGLVNFFNNHNGSNDNNGSNSNSDNTRISPSDFVSSYQLFYRNEYELNHLIGIFLGKRYRIFYEILYYFLQITQLWSYFALVGISMAQFVGISGISSSCDISGDDPSGNTYSYSSDCYKLYAFYCAMFWIWCAFMVLLDFTEQVSIQLTILVLRIIAFVLMIITSIGLIYGDVKYDSSDDGYYQVLTSTPHYGTNLRAFDFSPFFSFVMVVMFGLGNQFCVPDIIEPLKRSDRRKQNLIYGVSSLVYGVTFFLMGLTITVYFGNQTEDPCSLMWNNFVGFEWLNNRPAWSYLIAWIVVLLPPVDALTAYPLNAITFANTIEQSIISQKQLDSRFTFWKIFIRVGIVTVTFILGLVEWNYNLIANITGFANLIALFLLPAYAEYESQKLCQNICSDENDTENNENVENIENSVKNMRKEYITPITDWSSNNFWIWATVITAIISVIGFFITLIV